MDFHKTWWKEGTWEEEELIQWIPYKPYETNCDLLLWAKQLKFD